MTTNIPDPETQRAEALAELLHETLRDFHGGIAWDELGEFFKGTYRDRAVAFLRDQPVVTKQNADLVNYIEDRTAHDTVLAQLAEEFEKGAAAAYAALEQWYEPSSTERMYWPDVVNPHREGATDV